MKSNQKTCGSAIDSSKTTDYNGANRWSLQEIQTRYQQYARRFHVAEPIDLTPHEFQKGPNRWLYPVIDQVIDGVKANDRACIELAVEFVESDHHQPFGKILKCRASRALQRAALPEEAVERIRRRVLGMLVRGIIPHEFRDYARLLRKIGVGPNWNAAKTQIDPSNPYALRFQRYLDNAASQTERNTERSGDRTLNPEA